MGQDCHPGYRQGQARRKCLCLLAAGLWLFFSTVPALAHKVTIFAWVEGDTIYTQSKFRGGKKVKNCTVAVYDNKGNQLLEGKTDEKGEFSFKVPKKSALKVVLKASMGHMAEWKIPAAQIAGVAEVSDSSTLHAAAGDNTEDTVRSIHYANTDPQVPAATTVGLTKQQVQDLIDESLDKKLKPIVSMVSESLDHGPGLTEIIGGVGFIFGLVGVALYFSNRRKKTVS